MELLMVAGEPSGDYHGGVLARELKRLEPDCSLFGIGGERMASAGVELLVSIDQLGVTGFTEVIGRLPHILKVMRAVVVEARRRKPTAAVLIDYPDFNLRLARKLHCSGIPVIYYISPQLWAWRSWRVNLVRRYVRRMLVLFPFEADWYRSRDVEAVFVGNPLLDRFETVPSRDECRDRLSLRAEETVISVLPGSRRNEIQRHLPVLLEAVGRLRETERRRWRFLLCRAPHVSESFLMSFNGLSELNVEVVSEPSPIVLRAGDFAWVTSGTSTLETALAGTPMVIFYRTSRLSYILARLLVKVESIGMINLIAGRKIVPELIQSAFTGDRVAEVTQAVLRDSRRYDEMRQALAEAVRRLGEPGAARRAAGEVLKECRFLASGSA